jgi:polysaccharide biosynthesis transport protein
MVQEPAKLIGDAEPGPASTAQVAQNFLRFVLAVRYRKNVVIAALAAAAALGGLYYATATRYYQSKAAILITQVGPDQLNTSMTGEESQRRNTMPTFESMARSARVVEHALQSLSPEDRIDFEGAPQERWVEIAQKHLTSRAARGTSILDIAYTSRDPHVAVHVVNAIVRSYLDFMREMHQGTAAELMDQLTKQRTQIAGDLRNVQTRLLDARRELNDVKFDPESRTLHPMLERCVYFNSALIGIQKERAELEASSKAIDASVRKGEDIGQHLMAMGDVAGKEILMGILGVGPRDSSSQSNLETHLMEDRAELLRMQGELGPNHPELLAVRQRIQMSQEYLDGYQERIQGRLVDLRGSRLGPWLLDMVRQKLDEIREKENQLQARFEDARRQAVDLSGQLLQIQSLEAEEKRLGDGLGEIFKKIADLDMRRDGSEIRTAVTEQPVASQRPVSPRLMYVAILAVVGGFAAGLVLVHLLDALDDRFRSVDEIQSRLGVAVLSMVQQMKDQEMGGLESLTMHARPTSAESEAFRTLRTALELAHPDSRQFVISSAEPGDGKTTVLANLAVAYAQSEKKTLLIDADLRRPGLTRMTSLSRTSGLSEILRSDGEIAKLAATHIHASGIKNLDILPSGPRPSNPAELLAGARFSQFLAWAGGVYDHVLIDSPPALATSDTAVIGRLVDGVVLVVQPAKNRRRLVTRLVESLAMLKISVLGVVINRVGSAQDRGYYSYHSGYGYGYGYGYAHGYGYTPGYGHDEDRREVDRVVDEPTRADGPSDEPVPADDADDEPVTFEIEPPVQVIRRRAA